MENKVKLNFHPRKIATPRRSINKIPERESMMWRGVTEEHGSLFILT